MENKIEQEEFELDRKIEPMQLDLETLRQADTFGKWAQRAVEAKNDLDMAEENLEQVESHLQLDVRESPENHGLKEGTRGGAPAEAAVKAAIRTSTRYEKASKAYHLAKRRYAELEVAVKTMEMKMKTIETLAKLHGQQYFAGPDVPGDLVSRWKDYRQQRGERVTDRILDKRNKRVKADDE